MAASRYIRRTVFAMPMIPPLSAPTPPIAPLTPLVPVVDLMTEEGSAAFRAGRGGSVSVALPGPSGNRD